MNRDDANRELNRLVAHYRALPFNELLVLADQPVIETETSAPDGLTTFVVCLLYTSPSPRDGLLSRMPSSA